MVNFERQFSREAEDANPPSVDEIFSDTEQASSERAREMALLLKGSERILEEQREEGQGQAGETIAESFVDGRIEQVTLDRHFYMFPKQEQGNLIVVSDLHGDPEALYKAAKMLEEDEHNHLLSMGDAVTASDTKGMQHEETLRKLLRLHNAYPDKVHLQRGNVEADIAPVDKIGFDMYGAGGYKGFQENVPRMKRVFGKLPVGFATETGVVGVHGLLPRGVKEEGREGLHYRDLEEINNFSDYGDESEFSGREVRRMMWGEIREKGEGSRSEFKRSSEGMVSGSKGVLKALDAVGGNVLLRGHQHSLARRKGAAVSIDFNSRVGTFVSHELDGERRLAIIPLDKEVKKLTPDMFRKVD